MGTHTMLVIPADVEEAVYVQDVDDDDDHTYRQILTGQDDFGLDFASFNRHGFLVVVGGASAFDGSPVNTRAISVVRAATGLSEDYPLHGPVVIMGMAIDGDYADVPQRVLRAAGVIPEETT